jgi:hypothetical protein
MNDDKKNKEDEQQRQIRLIHALAARLPWIVVFFVLLTAIVTLIQIYLGWV